MQNVSETDHTLTFICEIYSPTSTSGNNAPALETDLRANRTSPNRQRLEDQSRLNFRGRIQAGTKSVRDGASNAWWRKATVSVFIQRMLWHSRVCRIPLGHLRCRNWSYLLIQLGAFEVEQPESVAEMLCGIIHRESCIRLVHGHLRAEKAPRGHLQSSRTRKESSACLTTKASDEAAFAPQSRQPQLMLPGL
jgi:hypothetical protein